MMTVAQLIELLQAHDPNALVAYHRYSEWCLMEPREVCAGAACEPRPDGWVQARRPDLPQVPYVFFPGN